MSTENKQEAQKRAHEHRHHHHHKKDEPTEQTTAETQQQQQQQSSVESAMEAVKGIRPVSAIVEQQSDSSTSSEIRPITAAPAGTTSSKQPSNGPNINKQQQQQQLISNLDESQIENSAIDAINWRIFALYSRRDFRGCSALIDTQLKDHPKSEYSLYVRALIKRQQGDIQESLRLFEQVHSINPTANNAKQIARSYFLLGKHKAAISTFERVEKVDPSDWETWHNKGLCHLYLKNYAHAVDCLRKANSISKHECTYLLLGRVYIAQENYKAAIEVFTEALEYSPEHPDILTGLGLLYLRTGENYRAFELFGNALNQDPTNPRTILAIGSIIQDHSEVEVALVKYRIAAVHSPHSSQLWNNVGLCFFSKQKYIAAIASLKKALYHAPFEWIISYNLGLVHLHTGQYASAFHFFSAAINLKPDFPITYMHLAITLSRLGDYKNACTAYDKAVELYLDPVVKLNYAIMQHAHGNDEQAKKLFLEFEKQWQTLDDETRSSDPSLVEQRAKLATALFPMEVAATMLLQASPSQSQSGSSSTTTQKQNQTKSPQLQRKQPKQQQ